MHFTDVFIRRPVLASVVSLLILLVGARSLLSLNIREYPETSTAVITVATAYPGAGAELVKGFITTPLEQVIASADGIDYLESVSLQGVSSINAYLELNYDAEDALAQIMAKVNQVRAELPEQSEDPSISIRVGQTTASMYISFYSEVLEPHAITDYLDRVVRPRIESVVGVQSATVQGASTFAMRIWLEPRRMAARGITASDVRGALAANNALTAAAATEGPMLAIDLSADTELHSADQFRELVVSRDGDSLVRLRDVAQVELGPRSTQSSVLFDGESASFMAIEVVPTANPLSVIQEIRRLFPDIQRQLPAGLEGTIVYDATEYIEESIFEVVRTLLEALVIVVVVIFLFLGSLRSVLVPAVAIPLSLVGTGLVMLAFGYSLNLLTLLALVLAIGMVVDDAIIVVENVYRHIENGEQPFDAAIAGARELAGPIVAMTLTIVAVYAPIAFIGGLTGSLFTAFAVTLAGAVLISGVVALTLSPMMASKVLRPPDPDRPGLGGRIQRLGDRLDQLYQRSLHQVLRARLLVVVVAGGAVVLGYVLFQNTRQELAPPEDQGFLVVQSTAAPNASIHQVEKWTQRFVPLFESLEPMQHHFIVSGGAGGGGASPVNQAFAGVALKPWSARDTSQMALQPRLQQGVAQVAGLDSVVFPPPSLPGAGSGLPIQFVIGTVESPRALYDVSRELLERARDSGLFAFVDSDLKYDKLQVVARVDRDKAATLGIRMRDIAADLGTLLSPGFVNFFSLQGRSYRVMPQARLDARLTPQDLEQYHLRTASGALVPAATLESLDETVQPRALRRFQQLDAATLGGVPAPGVAMGSIIDWLQRQAAEVLPPGYRTDYAGVSRQLVEEGGSLVITFFFALVVIYLLLAAQFESFRDPLIMLVSVPVSVVGALVFLAAGLGSLNIYTQLGMITLVALIAKHGILIVEFANQLQRRENLGRREAVERAATIRLRPILMTSAAMVAAMVPLLLAGGAGAGARFAIGLVIATGMGIGTLFTLYVVPAVYTYIAGDHRQAGTGHGPDTATSAGAKA